MTSNVKLRWTMPRACQQATNNNISKHKSKINNQAATTWIAATTNSNEKYAQRKFKMIVTPGVLMWCVCVYVV